MASASASPTTLTSSSRCVICGYCVQPNVDNDHDHLDDEVSQNFILPIICSDDCMALFNCADIYNSENIGPHFTTAIAKIFLKPINIYIVTLTGKTMLMTFQFSSSILDIKNALRDAWDLLTLIRDVRLIFKARECADDEILWFIGAKHNDTIHAILNLRGD